MKTFAVYLRQGKLVAIEVTNLSAASIDYLVGGNWFGVKASDETKAIEKAIAEGFKG